MKPPAITQQDTCSALLALYLWNLRHLSPSSLASPDSFLPHASQLCHKQWPLYCLLFSGLCMLSPLSRLTWPLLLCYCLTQPPHGWKNGANPSTLRTFLPHSLFSPLSLSPYLQVKACPFNNKKKIKNQPSFFNTNNLFSTISSLLNPPSNVLVTLVTSHPTVTCSLDSIPSHPFSILLLTSFLFSSISLW